MARFGMINWLLVLGVVVLAAVPLFIGSATEFGGADGVAVERIEEADPAYEPWFAPLFEPAAETASGLFALQAAIGAGVLGYVFGVARTRRRLRTPSPAGPGSAEPRPGDEGAVRQLGCDEGAVRQTRAIGPELAAPRPGDEGAVRRLGSDEGAVRRTGDGTA